MYLIARNSTDDRFSKAQSRVKAAIWVRPLITFAFLKLTSIPFVRVSTSARNVTRNDITFDMWQVARGDATRRNARLLEAKFSDGMCREAGSDGCKGIVMSEGKDPGCAMTNDKPVKNRETERTTRGETAIVGAEGWRSRFLQNAHSMLFKLCGLPAPLNFTLTGASVIVWQIAKSYRAPARRYTKGKRRERSQRR